MSVSQVRSENEARDLARWLKAEGRRRPVVVISTAAGRSDPYVDAVDVAAALGDLAEVHVIPTGEVSWAFSHAMPPLTQVYGGASRVYPIGQEWATRPSASPLRFAYGPKDRGRVTDLLVTDAMAMALAAGLLGAPSPLASVDVEGTVMGVAGSRAMVSTDRGTVTIWPELTVAGVDADRLFTKGMPVKGHLDLAQRRLDVRSSLRPAAELLAETYSSGATVLGRVTRLDAGGCHLELVPGMRVFVEARLASAVAGTPLTSVMTVGETVAGVVVRVGDAAGKGWQLDLVGVDPEVVPFAAALLPGGPPWLQAPAPIPPEPPDDDTAAADAVPAPLPVAVVPPREGVAPDLLGAEVAGLRAERDGFLAELEVARARVERLERTREQLRRQAREAGNEADRHRRRVQALTDELGRAAGDAELFLDPADQLDFDIRLTWARRVPAAEKQSLPLGRYVVGPQFLSSWAEISGVEDQKVVDVVVDILTGHVHDLAGRETHQLRTSEGGGSPFVTRPDGSTCWRVSLQVNTPQARRLHYWQRADGVVELSSVRQHDDIRP